VGTEPAVRTLAAEVAAGQCVPDHRHAGWHQFVCTDSGALTVRTGSLSFVVPRTRAVWIPADVPHALHATGRLRLRFVYVRADAVRGVPGRCTVVACGPLLRALVDHLTERGHLHADTAPHRRLLAVFVDLLAAESEAPLSLPMPRDARALAVAEAVLAAPAEACDLAAIADGSGASPRTVERLFVRELGWTFGRWRQQARLLHALQQLAAGTPVTRVALDVGYRSPSAFIAMFQRVLGATPGHYLARTAARS
jgi:AraC-like DNA-binding protein